MGFFPAVSIAIKLFYANKYKTNCIEIKMLLFGAAFLSVASPGIEPGSGASETLILSIVLRGRLIWQSADLKMC